MEADDVYMDLIVVAVNHVSGRAKVLSLDTGTIIQTWDVGDTLKMAIHRDK